MVKFLFDLGETVIYRNKTGSLVSLNKLPIVNNHIEHVIFTSSLELSREDMNALRSVFKHRTEKILRWLNRPNYSLFAIRINGEIAHFCLVLVCRKGDFFGMANNDDLIIENCDTLKKYQGRGLYKRNLAYICATWVPNRNAYINTSIHNFPSQKGIEGAGFEKLGVYKYLRIARFYVYVKKLKGGDMKTKVCHVSSGHDAFDDRIFYKECRSLANAGYETYFIVTHDKEEVIDEVHIVPLPEKSGRFYRFLLKDWIALIKSIKLKAELYHFHDPDLILLGLILKLTGKKVIYDVHEDFPQDILNKDWIGNLFTRKLVSRLFNILEKFSAKFFDGVIAATPDITKKFNIKKTIFIGNTPIIALIEETKLPSIKKDKPIIIYEGGLTSKRGIKELIEAMSFLRGKAELWLLGKWENENFKEECKNLNGWEYVNYIGFKEFKELYGYLKFADIGVINFLKLPNQEKSLPSKSFAYMACGLPMIMSNFSYWEKMFKSCAIFVDPQSPKDIAEKINILLDNKDLRVKLGNAGRDLVENRYSWEAESKKLINLYKELLK